MNDGPDGASPGADRAGADPYLVQLRAGVDQHFSGAMTRSPDAFRCGPGCASCCHRRIDVFAVEAMPIATALAELGARDPELMARIRRQADDPEYAQICPLLVDDRCSVYGSRPLICRSHGLPVLVETDDGPAVSVCPLNFDEQEIPGASILNLEALNAPLAVLAELRHPGAPRIGLEALARAKDIGGDVQVP